MAFSSPLPWQLLKQFKGAANGFTGRQAGEKIVAAILAHFHQAEITVLTPDGGGELFRVGQGSPSHGIHGVHIHPTRIQWGTWELKAHKDPVALLSDDNFNMYVGTLLQALETGRYRVGFKKR
jgi:hypothetical protein